VKDKFLKHKAPDEVTFLCILSLKFLEVTGRGKPFRSQWQQAEAV
jgi:hypothetical protein